MSELRVRPAPALRGCLRVPGDKSISHRALLLGALADGTSTISGLLLAGDCQATLDCLRALGVQIGVADNEAVLVHGRGLRGLQPPEAALNCRRSGTTMRLLAGILSGQGFSSTLTGDPQLLRRPMARVVDPIREMGGHIESNDGHAPLKVSASRLRGCKHRLQVASAQVKSALLLAGLNAEGTTVIEQSGPARDHTERMLATMGAAIHTRGLKVQLDPPGRLCARDFDIPGDLSSAASLLVAATLIPKSVVTLTDVGVNPTRTGLLDVLGAMGANIRQDNPRMAANEPRADLTVQSADLLRSLVSGEVIVRMIDELPVLAVAATQARGETLVQDAAELRVKETDRISALVAGLRALGAHIEPRADGFVIEGPTALHGGRVNSQGDHRLAMALCVAGLIAQEEVVVENVDCIDDSFPGFVRCMREIGADVD